MKLKEIKAMNEADLDEKIIDLRKDLIKLNAQVSTGTTLKSPCEIRKIRKVIAKMLTIKKIKTKEDNKKDE